MRSNLLASLRLFIATPLVVAGLLACGPGGTATPDLAMACDTTQYPCGPFGSTEGSVVSDRELLARRDDDKNGTVVNDPSRKVRLSDYYKDKSIKVVVLLFATEWCIPCINEQPDLITIYNDYQSVGAGVAFLEIVTEDTASKPADLVVADRWAARKWAPTGAIIPFDVGFDPTLSFSGLYNPMIYPTQVVISTKDMTIRWQHVGEFKDKAEVKAQIDAALK